MKADILLTLSIILAIAGILTGFNACIGVMMEGPHHPEPWYFAAASLSALVLATILFVISRILKKRKSQEN